MQVSLEYAKEHLADLVSAAYRGEEVEIAAPDQPALRLGLAASSVPDSAWSVPERPRAELFGSLAGKIELADDWDSPETNDAIADLFENGEVFPDATRP